jgi:hypothetical protein
MKFCVLWLVDWLPNAVRQVVNNLQIAHCLLCFFIFRRIIVIILIKVFICFNLHTGVILFFYILYLALLATCLESHMLCINY